MVEAVVEVGVCTVRDKAFAHEAREGVKDTGRLWSWLEGEGVLGTAVTYDVFQSGDLDCCSDALTMEARGTDNSDTISFKRVMGMSMGVAELLVRHCCSLRPTWCTWVVGIAGYAGRGDVTAREAQANGGKVTYSTAAWLGRWLTQGRLLACFIVP